MEKVFAVVYDNGLEYEDRWVGIVKLFSTEEKALSYIEQEKEKWNSRGEDDWWSYENPKWSIREEEVL
jgi:hypothetical protein